MATPYTHGPVHLFVGLGSNGAPNYLGTGQRAPRYRLRREYEDAGRSTRFEELIAVLTRDPKSDPYAEIARRLGTTEGNVRVAVHRLRRRYGLLLREEIAATVGDVAQVDDEIQALFAALAG